MGKSDNYFTFPLAVLVGESFDANGSAPVATPLNCIELALDCGILGAGKGFRVRHGDEAFKARLDEVCDKLGIKAAARPGLCSSKGEVLVGAAVCNVKLGNHQPYNLERIAGQLEKVVRGGPLVRMKSEYFWAALGQARAESDPDTPWPQRGVSWREFRILAAILSVKTNRAGFAFIGWETVRARSCGFTTKEAFQTAEVIPDHLAPSLTHKQIRSTCDSLENLGFFARFRFSSGTRGGHMAYSFKHDRESLGDAVCDFINFRDQVQIRKNRSADAAKCLKLLKRTKPGQSNAKGKGKANGNGGGKHNEKSTLEKSSLKNPTGAGDLPIDSGEIMPESIEEEIESGDPACSDRNINPNGTLDEW